MKMKKMMFLMLTLLVWGAVSMNAQVRVGGTADPNPNALLDVNKDTITVTGNNTGGLALPRVALTSTTISAPVGTRFVKGMLVYNTATAGTAPNNVTPGAYYSDGAKWIRVSGSDAPIAGWQLGGNTVADGDFIGATNNKPLVFKINGDTVGYVNKGTVAAWGDKALAKNTGTNNTAVGANALAVHITGNSNTAIGASALLLDETGANNTAVGYASLRSNTDGQQNTAVGFGSLYSNTVSGNTAVGARSLYTNSTGVNNVAVGDSALRLSTASGNTAVGYRALGVSTSGRYNTAVGDSASSKTTTGSRNTTIGHLAGLNITTGSNNIVIGDSAVAVSATASNQLKIGDWITGTNGRIRIGNANPHTSAVLDLNASNDTTPEANIAGLGLPRISLASTTTKLNTATPLEGTLVYNTNPSMTGGTGTGTYEWKDARWRGLLPTMGVTSITLYPSQLYLPVENTVPMKATANPVAATNKSVTWESSDPTVASVDDDGNITGESIGTATVTARAVDGSGISKSATVTVFADGSGSATIGSHEYDVYTFPNGAGTWMIQNSLEGTPTKTRAGVNYYLPTVAASACPATSGFALPDSTQFRVLSSILTLMPPNYSPWFTNEPLAGRWSAVSGYAKIGTQGLWNSSTPAGHGVGNVFLIEGLSNSVAVRATQSSVTYASTVRCVKIP
ncbi:hypothetical protein FACS189437_09020 [Bacteroidia bacterium]|nr:hypothetical protein FACS189437_09020 [Bacteroidia bacterium]